MPVNTTTAAAHITPVVVKTFLTHARRKAQKLKQGNHQEEATDDLLFDQAFNIVKSFIELGTKNTIESLQQFTNTHVPAPFWSVVAPVLIPFSSCNKAADLLVQWFGPDDLKNVVGGEKWWQVRGLEGVDAEWVTEKELLSAEVSDMSSQNGKKLTDAEKSILRMEHLDTVMLYVHGGGYFWGSVNTHRYQIIRYARKIGGRAFAVNYRKAPQYPWPCPVQDVLAAYFYLIDPPLGALHKPIPPSNIVLAGDSAGGGLCISTLAVLRDMGIELPAGAVLISPWVDLTHSFPSVMKNTLTDIIPPHGFIHKPSPLWPVDPLPRDGSRVLETRTNPPPQPGHADTLKPSAERVQSHVSAKVEQNKEGGEPIPARDLKEEGGEVMRQKDMIETHKDDPDADDTGARRLAGTALLPGEKEVERSKSSQDVKEEKVDSANEERAPSPASSSAQASSSPTGSVGPSSSGGGSSTDQTAIGQKDDLRFDYWEPKPPKVLMENSKDKPLELRAQIQQYATTEQLTHPLVSAVLQGSLGNLCPLYIIAGDHEVLRDEITYLAHKAAYPSQYPTREGILSSSRRQAENQKKFTKPTRVHLQVYDDMCHVLTVFTFTPAAKYAYRSIAQFVRHVTSHPRDYLERHPFPELHIDSEEIPEGERKGEEDAAPRRNISDIEDNVSKQYKEERPPLGPNEYSSDSDIKLFRQNKETTRKAVREGQVDKTRASDEHGTEHKDELSNSNDDSASDMSPNANGPSQGDKRQANNDTSSKEELAHVLILRERVDIFGHIRQMEPKEEIEALNMKPQEIGIIKEAPVKRWLRGQEMWDQNFKHAAQAALKKRKHYEEKAERLLRNAREQGLMLQHETRPQAGRLDTGRTSVSSNSIGEIEPDRRWGPLDLDDENPPPTAIAARRDTRDAVALLKKTIYHNAPRTHQNVPKLKTSDAILAALDPNDSPTKPPQQSVSEQQVEHRMLPIHGLRIWQSLVSLFMRKSSKKAARGRKQASSAVTATTDKIRTGSSHQDPNQDSTS